MKNIRIAVFDDNQPRRELLQILLDSAEGFTCTGAYEDCRDVLRHIAGDPPDVVLMDIDMPHVNGIEGLALIKQHFPQVKVLMQTIFEDENKIFNAIMAGADGYILKKASPLKLLDGIREVMEGGAPMTPVVAKQVLQLFNNKNKSISKNDFALTPREMEIISLLVEGYSYKMIAGKCNVTYATVNTHISSIYHKLQVSSGTEAVAKAIESGIAGRKVR
jgi:DNA-binding NarL/FixJ family response regulator